MENVARAARATAIHHVAGAADIAIELSPPCSVNLSAGLKTTPPTPARPGPIAHRTPGVGTTKRSADGQRRRGNEPITSAAS